MQIPYSPAVEAISRSELKRIQFAQLMRCMEHLQSHNTFIRSWFQRHDVRVERIKSLRDFAQQVPLMDKGDLVRDQESRPPFGHRLSTPIDRVAQVVMTSGTSGLGQEIHPHSALDVELIGSVWVPHLYWCGLRPGDVAVNTVPIGMLNAGWSMVSAFTKIGAVPLHTFGMTTKATIQLLKRYDASWIWVTPPYLTRLMVTCEEMGFDPRTELTRLKGICVATEAFPISWGQRVEEFWGTRLHEAYGTTQGGGVVGGTCERGAVPNGERGCIHLLENYLLVEVIDPVTGDSVGEEGEGEAVLTSLHLEASPIVRFRMHDKVRLLRPERCSCGRPFAIWESGTISRYDDMIKMRAMNVWPSAVDSIVFGHPEVEEYVGVVSVDAAGREVVAVSIALKSSALERLSAEEQSGLLGVIRAQLKEGVGVNMDVRYVPRSELPVFEFKSRRWSDQRHKGLAG